ncbi:MAG: hypothetical protein OEW19_07455 [Acidobacteriota bacterium]|nr:hypothetical protein [Acidobacteriota bacterium]
MRRRTLLQAIVSTLPALPLARVRLSAQVRELTPEAVAVLREVGAAVLPASLGEDRVSLIVDRFIAWAHAYEEGVPLSHGYGHPRLVKSPASPVPDYIAQLSTLAEAARAQGGRLGALPLETRRTLLSESLAAASVVQLPGRPLGRHVVADLMAYYFRSSEANDQAYRARIGRQLCRTVELTTRRPTSIA